MAKKSKSKTNPQSNATNEHATVESNETTLEIVRNEAAAVVEDIDESAGQQTRKASETSGNVPKLSPPMETAVKDEIENCTLAMYGFVIGSKPSKKAIRGYFKRIWKNYSFTNLSFLPNGVFITQFAKKDHQDLVIQKSLPLFNGKLVIIKALDLNTKISEITAPSSVQIWVKFMDLNLIFFGKRCLEKLSSLVGTFVQLHERTEDKTWGGWAEILVDVKIDQELPDWVVFRDHNGKKVSVRVEYDLTPSTDEEHERVFQHGY